MISLGEALRGNQAEQFSWSVEAVLDLLLRPGEFFRQLLDSRSLRFPFLSIWLWGVALAVDRIDTRMILEDLMGQPGRMTEIASTWPRFYVSIILGGLIAGPLSWLVAGWWYRMRLWFCGAKNVDPRQARYVFLYSNLVFGVPLLLSVALNTPFYPNYVSASLSGTFGLSLMASALWSVFVSYHGAIACFEVRRVAARIWFLILPMGIIGGIFLTFTAITSIATL